MSGTNLLLLIAVAIAVVGTYTPWSKIQGLPPLPIKAVCVVYILSWLVLAGFGIAAVNEFYSYKEALR